MRAPTERHTIAVLVDNEAGVLARVVGLFSGRGYNIESLTVAEVDHAAGKQRYGKGGQYEGDDERGRHGQRQKFEERAGDTRQEGERNEDDGGRQAPGPAR